MRLGQPAGTSSCRQPSRVRARQQASRAPASAHRTFPDGSAPCWRSSMRCPLPGEEVGNIGLPEGSVAYGGGVGSCSEECVDARLAG